MKKIITAVLLGVSLFITLPVFANGGLSQLIRSNVAWINDSSNATTTVLSGTSGTQYTILGLLLSVSSADNLTLKCGTRQVLSSIYLGANSGFTEAFVPLAITCNAGEAINITKGTASTPIGVSIWYSQDNQ